DARRMAGRWAEMANAGKRAGGSLGLPDGARLAGGADTAAGAVLALAYPDRVAKARGGGAGGAVLLASGRGATVAPASAL
ncbi:hypothetical protein CH338_31425, partial [Rhodoplanes elegans]